MAYEREFGEWKVSLTDAIQKWVDNNADEIGDVVTTGGDLASHMAESAIAGLKMVADAHDELRRNGDLD